MRDESRLGGSITRRQLLKRLGVAGGSSLLLGTMNAWKLSAGSAGSRPGWTGDRQGTRVLVLGGGVSGLVVAYELGKLGYDARVLEARDRVGGLNWSVKRGMEHTEIGPDGERQICEFDEGKYFNAGPWRIPNDHEGILGYCKELGVRLERFVNDDTVMFSDDPALGSLSNRMIQLREIQSDLWGSTAELLAKAVDQGALDEEISGEDKERLLEFLVGAGYLDDADRLYSPNPELRGSDDPYDLSLLLQTPFLRQVRSIDSGTGGPVGYFQPTGGMMEIPLAFQRALGDRITFQAEVTRVGQGEDEAEVTYLDTGTGEYHQLTADYVVCCLPMSILKQIDVAFSPEIAALVESTGHSQSSKMGFQMARRFWEEDHGIFGGHLRYSAYNPGPTEEGGRGRGGNPIPSFSYPSNDYRSKKGVLLGFYGNPSVPGLDGTPLIESPVSTRVEYVLHHASRVHPQMRAEFEAAYAVMWPKVKYSEGAWAGRLAEDAIEQVAEGDGRIYIGAAGAGGNASWQEGAVATAWRAVESIHRRTGQA